MKCRHCEKELRSIKNDFKARQLHKKCYFDIVEAIKVLKRVKVTMSEDSAKFANSQINELYKLINY